MFALAMVGFAIIEFWGRAETNGESPKKWGAIGGALFYVVSA